MIGAKLVPGVPLLAAATPAAAQGRLWGHSGEWRIEATPPRLRGTVEALTTADDYPAFALRAQIGGRVRIRLPVTAHGYASRCSVAGSSGSARLDQATCSLHLRRARFSAPPLDAQGRATRGGCDIVKDWVLPAGY